ncbi:hypothetical protein [Neotamlana laminarinivorans]|uniref:Secreted protein n=1 Tax=Neotamlana laminarinivorans TaxID=2883124 RepID=A0A9X1L1A6_9FLAO|nr:hypothetical protein [Tamlana laminarinivorans]MCB4798450.1 hypothetical protein [Tamlana laminarinivorans]
MKFVLNLIALVFCCSILLTSCTVQELDNEDIIEVDTQDADPIPEPND